MSELYSCTNEIRAYNFIFRIRDTEDKDLSPIILFGVLMDMSLRCSPGAEEVWFGNLRVSLLFADDVVLIVFSGV